MKENVAIPDRIIAFVAPRGSLDYWSKVFLLILIIGLMNFIRDNIEHGSGADSLFANVIEAAPIGLPFCLLSLSLIARLKRVQDNLIALAATDMLTGLNNRRAFYERVAEIPDGTNGVLMIIDADHFKRVNDTYGHGIGDLCLQQIAKHLIASVRENDIVARIGGEEFAVVMLGADRETAEGIGARLVEGVMLEVGQDDTITVTLSVGAVMLAHLKHFDTYMGLADEALYVAKSSGRARIVLASDKGAAAGVMVA